MTRGTHLYPPFLIALASYVVLYALCALSAVLYDKILKTKVFSLLHFFWFSFNRVGEVQYGVSSRFFDRCGGSVTSVHLGQMFNLEVYHG